MNETTLTCSLDKQDEVHLFKERKRSNTLIMY